MTCLSFSLFLELLLVSYEVEPPDSPREKIHYQELKLVYHTLVFPIISFCFPLVSRPFLCSFSLSSFISPLFSSIPSLSKPVPLFSPPFSFYLLSPFFLLYPLLPSLSSLLLFTLSPLHPFSLFSFLPFFVPFFSFLLFTFSLPYLL